MLGLDGLEGIQEQARAGMVIQKDALYGFKIIVKSKDVTITTHLPEHVTQEEARIKLSTLLTIRDVFFDVKADK